MNRRYAAVLVFLAACSSQPPPPPPVPDGGGGLIECDPACDPDTQLCNLTTGECQYNSDTLPQMNLIAAREAPHGAADLSIEGALVTWAISGEPAASGANGFFLQSRKEGPALFVAVDPDTLNPAPAPGDKVSLRVTLMHKLDGLVEARAVTAYQRMSTGHDVSALVQDVTARGDLVTAGAELDGELVAVAGRIRHDWLALAATGHFKAELELPSGFANPNFFLRANTVVTRPMGLGTNCNVALQGVPLRRSNGQTQIFGLRNEDFTQRNCPPTRLVNAIATSPTHVKLTFERPVDATSILSNGSQFDFGGGLAGTYAAVLPTTYDIVVTTGVQTARADHVIAIASTAKDVVGGTLVVPAQKAAVLGYFPRAHLLLNELNCAMSNDRDLIELRAATAGSTMGMQLTYEGTISGTIGVFPDAEVEEGDIILVHLNANPSFGDSVYNETASKDEIQATSNHDTAWDFVYDKFSCGQSNVVVRVKAPDGTTVDGVALVNTALNASQRPADYGAVWLKGLQLDNHWQPKTCNGLTCSYFSEPTALDVSVDWRYARTINGVVGSISRKDVDDTDTRDDWVITPNHSFGRPNPGQP